MEHGLIPSPRTEAEVQDIETNGFDGQYQLDIIPITWGANLDPDSWWGPGWEWKFPHDSGTDVRREDLEKTFGGTGRRCCFSYRLTPGGTEEYYEPGATGQLDSAWESFAEDLVAMNLGDSVIRPSPEHTHPWSRRYPADANGNDLPTIGEVL